MTLRFTFLLLLLAGLAMPAAAQDAAVTGRVVDAGNSLPLPTATVALYAADSLVAGSTTNIEGAFRVEAPTGTYDVRVSFVGYEEVRQLELAVSGETDLGEIGLVPEAEALGEVSVAAERPQRQARIDRTVYDTADDPVADGGNATDVLSTIPSVDVDIDGNISLRGSGNVAVFINGRPAPVSSEFVASYLASLPAGAIDRVEVIPNPSAAFEPDGVGGILNIVLKEDVDAGVGGTLTAGTDSQGGVDLSTAITYGKGPWSLAATYGFRNDIRAGAGTSYRINRYETAPTVLDQAEDEDRTRTSHLVNLSAEYAASRATMLSSSIQLGTRGSEEAEFNTTLRTASSGDPIIEYERLAEELDDGLSGDLRLGLRHTFGDNHRLTIEARAKASEEDETQTYSETLLAGSGDLDAPQRVFQDESERELSLRVDYTRPLGGLTLDLGYAGDVDRQNADLLSESLVNGAYIPDEGVNNAYAFDQMIHAAYAQAAGEWGQWGLQAGLRAEAATTTFDLLTTQELFDSSYQSLFPSAFLAYSPTDLFTLRGGYSRRINRPRSRSLNPFPSFDDPLNIRQGNPALKPEYVDAVEVSANLVTGFGSLALTPYYRRTTDVIRRLAVVGDDGVTIRTSQNLDTADAYGAEAVVAYEGGPLRGYVSFEGYRLQTEGATADTDLSNDAFGWGGRANLSYGLGNRFGWGDLDLQATARYSAPIGTEQGRVGARTFVDLALRQKIGDQASLTLQARDPLGLAGFSYTLDQPDLYQEFERNWGAQQIGLTFSYTFGQKSRDRDRQQGERDGGGDFEGEEFTP